MAWTERLEPTWSNEMENIVEPSRPTYTLCPSYRRTCIAQEQRNVPTHLGTYIAYVRTAYYDSPTHGARRQHRSFPFQILISKERGKENQDCSHLYYSSLKTSDFDAQKRRKSLETRETQGLHRKKGKGPPRNVGKREKEKKGGEVRTKRDVGRRYEGEQKAYNLRL